MADIIIHTDSKVYQILQTVHHERSRNKVHKFREVYKLTEAQIQQGYATGYTKCGHMTYVPLVTIVTNIGFINECKKCFRDAEKEAYDYRGEPLR